MTRVQYSRVSVPRNLVTPRRESAEWTMNLAERQERSEHPATERHGWDRWLGERQLGSALHNLDHSATPFDTPVC